MRFYMSEHQKIVEMNQKYTYFSWSVQSQVNPIAIEKAEGVYLWDMDGKRYLDFSSQLILTNIGHNDARVISAINEQMKKFCYVQPSFATKVRGELGKKLAEITPGDLCKTFFTLGGAEGIENAMKMARLYTGKQKIITRYRAYHGGTIAAAAAGGDPRRVPIEPSVGWIIHMHDPYSYRSPIYKNLSPEQGDMLLCDLLEETIKLEGESTVAAVLLEGFSGSSGVIAPSTPAYWQRVREICDKYNVVLICDEVMSGFGRTGKWFGIDHYNITPDIMVMAKGLTSGYLPLGAVITNQKIADYFEDKMLACGLTYSAHATCCAAALATIAIYESDQLIENARLLGEVIREKLTLWQKSHPSLGEFRGTGLHWCLELVKNKTTKEEISEWNKPQNEVMVKLNHFLKDNGISAFTRWNQLYICPPLSISLDQLNLGLDIIDQALALTDQACEH